MCKHPLRSLIVKITFSSMSKNAVVLWLRILLDGWILLLFSYFLEETLHIIILSCFFLIVLVMKT